MGSGVWKVLIAPIISTLNKNQTAKDAVIATMEEVGPDPQHKSQLLYYPDSVSTSTEAR